MALAERKPTTGGVLLGSSYDEARTRKINAEAEIAELELQRIKATMCFTADVVKAWENVLHSCRAKMLAIPTKMAPVVAGITDVSAVKERIEEAVREALDELANYNPTVDPVRTGATTGTATGAAPADDAEKPKRSVGRPRKIDKMKR